ncbi:hypothetical protein H6768_01740 [Candidatus Peribacteria bacterium]|nr:hypothetical protein [Candidatus Peribacteria bacterium]
MSLYLFFGILGVLLGLTAYTIYFRAIFRKETKPHLYTWMIWGVLGITGSMVSFQNEGGW